jgi:hypothetical protein
MARRSAWGDGSSLGKEHLKTFFYGAPQEEFPKHYLCRPDDNEDQCSFDFLSKGKCSPYTRFDGCRDDEVSGSFVSTFCKKVGKAGLEGFYNPREWPRIGTSEELGFQVVKLPNEWQMCSRRQRRNGAWETYGSSSMCFMSNMSSKEEGVVSALRPGCFHATCARGSLTVEVGDEEKKCLEEGQKLSFDGFIGELVCPNPDLMCAMWDYYSMQDAQIPRQKGGGQSMAWLANPFIWAGTGAALLCVVIAAVWIGHRGRESNGPNDPVWEIPPQETYRLRDDIVIELPPDDGDVQIQ